MSQRRDKRGHAKAPPLRERKGGTTSQAALQAKSALA